jgi:hypothetical protein
MVTITKACRLTVEKASKRKPKTGKFIKQKKTTTQKDFSNQSQL